MTDWSKAIREERTATLRYANRRLMGEDDRAVGKVVGYSIVPQVLIETDDGETIWWREDLVTLHEPKPTVEEMAAAYEGIERLSAEAIEAVADLKKALYRVCEKHEMYYTKRLGWSCRKCGMPDPRVKED